MRMIMTNQRKKSFVWSLKTSCPLLKALMSINVTDKRMENKD